MLNLQSIYFGQKHKDFDFKDMELIKKIKRLATKHQKQCENSCNGYGTVKGQVYYNGTIDDYAKRTYGLNVKSAYLDNEETVFDKEIDHLEAKIKSLLGISHCVFPIKDKGFIADKYRLDFQHDPRGATVRLYYEDYFINLWN